MSSVYRAEINGLRALAVISVVFFHAGFEVFKNGFIGVDIFFVISGYLITTLIIKDLINKNFLISFFFERRARRILPALYFVMIITIPFAWTLLGRNELSSYLKSITSTVFFLSNFFFWSEIPYFESEANFKPLLHTWSLSVEEQFYIFFPLLIIYIYKLNKKLIIYILEIIFILSLLLSLLILTEAPNANFYFPITRIWEFLIGGIVAYLIIDNRFNISKLSNNILSLFGLLIIICSFFFNTIHLPAAFFPTIGAALIIIFANKDTLVGKFLSIKAFVGIGIISYSLYLWHYPIFAFAKNYYSEINLQLKFLIILLSFILSVFSYKFIEKPFRNNKFISLKNFTKLIILLTLLLVLFSFSTFNYFEKKGGNEPLLAKLLVKNDIIFSYTMNERIFIKNRIIYENYNPQILVVGSSRIMQLAENELKKKTLNLSVSGASLEDQIAITEMALEKFNPTTIYLGADPWLFHSNNNQKQWRFIQSEYHKTLLNINSWKKEEKKNNFNKKKIINEFDKITYLTFGENMLEKVYSSININSSFSLPANIQPTQHKGLILRDGKIVYDLEYQNKKKQEEIIKYSSMNNYEFSAIKFENYDNFLEYLKNYHKKNVILVLSPYYNPSFELTVKKIPVYLEIEKQFINLADKHKIKIIGSYDPKLVNCSNNEFYDSMHPKDICIKKIIGKIN